MGGEQVYWVLFTKIGLPTKKKPSQYKGRKQ